VAWEVPLEKHTFVTEADLSAKQYYAVKINNHGKIILSGAGENAVGILQDKPGNGYVGSVMTLGITKAVYGGAVTAGDNLSADAAGKLVTTAGAAAVIGVALEDGADGEIHPVLLSIKTSLGINGGFVIAIPVILSKIAAGDILTDYIPGINGKIIKFALAVTDPATTAGKGATLNLEIEAANLTGGVLTLTSDNCTPLGAVVAATAITGNNTLGATQKISIECSAAADPFIEGEGVFLITIQ
jgi:hypothetical protein